MFLTLALILGALIGSFLNVVIYRYPIMLERAWTAECKEQLQQPLLENQSPFNLCVPRSHCVHCKKPLRWYHNIPLLSFIFLRGRCSYCQHKISAQYFLIEVLSAVFTAAVYMHFQWTWATLAVLFFTWCMIASSMIDAHHQFLPDPITYSVLWLGLLVSTQSMFISPAQAIMGALVGYLFLYAIAKLYLLWRKTEGMGLGDCKLLAMIGAWVGTQALLNVLIIASGLALCLSLIFIATKKLQKNNHIICNF